MQYNIFENMELAIQNEEIPFPVVQESVLMMIKILDPDTWHLSEPKELWVRKNATVSDLAQTIASSCGLDEWSIDITRVGSPAQFHRVILQANEWFRL